MVYSTYSNRLYPLKRRVDMLSKYNDLIGLIGFIIIPIILTLKIAWDLFKNIRYKKRQNQKEESIL